MLPAHHTGSGRAPRLLSLSWRAALGYSASVRARLIALGLLLLPGCGGRGLSLTILFPSQLLAGATSMIELELLALSGKAEECPRLVRDEKPLGAVSLVEHRLAAFPFAAGALEVERLGDGAYAALVSGWNRASKRERFLRGCASIAEGASGSSLRVELAEQRGCCRSSDPACTGGGSASCYDAPSHTAGRGPCTKGTAACDGAFFGTCVGQVLPGPERCNGIDDDCDGVVDNACTGADGGSRDGGALDASRGRGW